MNILDWEIGIFYRKTVPVSVSRVADKSGVRTYVLWFFVPSSLYITLPSENHSLDQYYIFHSTVYQEQPTELPKAWMTYTSIIEMISNIFCHFCDSPLPHFSWQPWNTTFFSLFSLRGSNSSRPKMIIRRETKPPTIMNHALHNKTSWFLPWELYQKFYPHHRCCEKHRQGWKWLVAGMYTIAFPNEWKICGLCGVFNIITTYAFS